MEPERILIADAAKITGLCERTLQSLSQKGQIWGAAKLGKRWTFDRQRLRAWVLANEQVTSRKTSTSATVFGMGGPLSAGWSGESPLKLAIERKLKGVERHG